MLRLVLLLATLNFDSLAAAQEGDPNIPPASLFYRDLRATLVEHPNPDQAILEQVYHRHREYCARLFGRPNLFLLTVMHARIEANEIRQKQTDANKIRGGLEALGIVGIYALLLFVFYYFY